MFDGFPPKFEATSIIFSFNTSVGNPLMKISKLGWAKAFPQDKASLFRVTSSKCHFGPSSHHFATRKHRFQSIPNHYEWSSLGPVFLLGLSAFAMVAACASRAAVKSAISCRRASKLRKKMENGFRFLGGNSSSGTKRNQRGSNSNDGGNTGDGVKIAGGVIGSGDEIVNSLA
ncbi:hypothetical protein Tco_0762366 [Tanacetum coccineum]